MSGRRKLLLTTAKALHDAGKYGRTALVKTLFVLSREANLPGIKHYSFFPYRFGSFSNTAYADLRYAERQGLMDIAENLTPNGVAEAEAIKPAVAAAVAQCVERFRNQKALVDYVYATYPEYTIKSELKPHEQHKPVPAIFTIGYEGRDIDAFLDQLVQNEITVLVDVRNNPFSMNFAFIKSKLEGYLKQAGISYLHVPELGVESAKRKNLDSAEDYGKLFTEYAAITLPQNQAALDKIISLGGKERIALMCFEHDAVNCHRGVLAKALRERGLEVSDL